MPEATDTLATVNGQPLTFEEGQRQIAQFLAQQQVPPQARAQVLQQHGPQLLQQVVTQFIDSTLLKEEVDRRDITPDKEAVDAALARISESLPDGTTIEEATASQGTNVEALREDIAAGDRVRKLFEVITAEVSEVTDEHVAEFYKANPNQFTSEATVTARHILIKCETDADETLHQMCKAKAESVRGKLVAGADFAEQATECSDCPSKNQGGSLGAFGRGKMAPEFEEASFSQAVDEIGPVVKTSFGYHLIQVTAKEEGKTASFEDVSNDIRTHLNGSAKHEVFQVFTEGLRDSADIQITGAP